MARPALATIRLDALRHNYRLARQTHGGRALAVIKADAYGHGAVASARALADLADGFAVACIEEALSLREAGIRQPVLLLEGFFSPDEIALIRQHQLWCVIHHRWQVEALLAAPPGDPVAVWLKLDSGMHRAGLDPVEYRDAWHRLAASAQVQSLTAMTHFARADEPDQPATARQMACFEAVTAGLPGARSLSNSAAILGWPAARGDSDHWARPGIMLYGADPMGRWGTDQSALAAGLRPVMQLETGIIAVRDLPAGEPIGYGGTFVTQAPTRVGVIACGYADGYPRHAPTGTPVAVEGQRTRLIGRVSMDMITIDLTDLPAADVGSRVELWGDTVSANEVAHCAGTIAYELFCGLKRIPSRWR